MDETITLQAPGKINLGLEITGRRSDGYHDVATVLQMIDLHDEIIISPATQLSYESPISQDRNDDLIWRAVTRFREQFSTELNVKIQLTKNIPDAAGLGGGSSDAGTLLKWLMEWTGSDPSRVHKLAAELGSDVPFFLDGPTALAVGTGTDLVSVNSQTQLWVICATPAVTIHGKTARLYGSLEPGDFSDGSATHEIARGLSHGMLHTNLLHNAFARRLYQYPEIERALVRLMRAGAENVIPSGAGPTLLAIVESEEMARAIYDQLNPAEFRSLVITRTLTSCSVTSS